MTSLSAKPNGSDSHTLVPGEFRLTSEDFRAIAQAIYSDAGIHMPESKATLVYSRLARRLRALGLESFKAYCDLIRSDEGLDERQKMLAALTTNVTRFFSESQGEKLVTGLERLDLRILASDIDPNVVAEGRIGRYEDGALADVTPDLRRRYFTRTTEGGRELNEVSEDMKRIVSFRELNLFAPWPMKKKFDLIFCRNVAIYFDQDHQASLWQRFASALTPGGFLYIGHSERLSGPATEVFSNDGITTWRLEAGR